jgi:hypothetical protein
MHIDVERKVATFKCPVCGYVVLVHLTVEILDHAKARLSTVSPGEAESEAGDD